MTILVDTGVLYADHDTDATRHEVAENAVSAVYDGEFGQPYVSDYIFDEAVTLTVARSDSHLSAVQLGKRIRGIDPFPHLYELLYISPADFRDAVAVFETYDDQRLSFTDASSVALVRQYNIDHILSFDEDFDGLVDRIDPADV